MFTHVHTIPVKYDDIKTEDGSSCEIEERAQFEQDTHHSTYYHTDHSSSAVTICRQTDRQSGGIMFASKRIFLFVEFSATASKQGVVGKTAQLQDVYKR